MTQSVEAKRRKDMVKYQISGRGVRCKRVLAAMQKVPREKFLPTQLREFAYDDGPLPIGEQQTISQPYIVALMTEALALGGGDRVLEIGTGSGYAAAVLAEIASEVYTIERIGQLARKSASLLTLRKGRNKSMVAPATGTGRGCIPAERRNRTGGSLTMRQPFWSISTARHSLSARSR